MQRRGGRDARQARVPAGTAVEVDGLGRGVREQGFGHQVADAAGLEGARWLQGFELEVDVAGVLLVGTLAEGGRDGMEIPACFERECCGADEWCLDPWFRGLFAVGTHSFSL